MRSRIIGTILSGLLLIGPAGSARARVTGIAFDPKGPVVGHSVTAIAVDDGKHEVVKWSWSYTLAAAGTSDNPVAIRSADPGRAKVDLRCGGTYTFTLEVTYGGPMAPPPETVSAALTVPRPDAIRIVGGLDVPVLYQGTAVAIMTHGRVLSLGADTGVHLLGQAQRRIRNRTWWAGKKDPDRPWEPDAPGNMMAQVRGEIEDMVLLNIDRAEWEKVPIGKPIVTWDEDVRLIYIVGYKREVSRLGKAVTVECSLGTEHLAIVKRDDQHWVVRRSEKAGASGAPAGQGGPAGTSAPASKDRAAARASGGRVRTRRSGIPA